MDWQKNSILIWMLTIVVYLSSQPITNKDNSTSGRLDQYDPSARIAYYTNLAKSQDRQLMNQLLEGLGDEHEEVAKQVAKIVAGWDHNVTWELILPKLQPNAPTRDRLIAILALQHIHHPQDVASLSSIIRQEKHPKLLGLAIRALIGKDLARASVELTKLLEQRPSSPAHLAILKQIENSREYSNLWPVIMNLAGDPSEQIRRQVVMIWGVWKMPITKDWVVARLNDPSPLVQCAMFWALGEIEDAEWIPLLCQVASDPQAGWEKRCSAINSLGKFPGRHEIYQTLLANLDDPTPLVRATTAKQICQFPILVEQSQGKLLDRLHQKILNPQEDHIVCTAICNTLGEWGYADSISSLSEVWWKQNCQVVTQRQNNLLLASDTALTKLAILYPDKFCQNIMNTQTPAVLRQNYILMLARSKEKLTKEEIANIIVTLNLLLTNQQDDENVRATALMLLTDLQEKSALPQLYQSLHDPQIAVREIAILGLGRLRDQQKIAELFALLAHSNANIRSATIWAISQLPLESARPYVLKTLQEQNEDVLMSGIMLVAFWRVQEAIPSLLTLYEKEQWQVPVASTFEQLLPDLPKDYPERDKIIRIIHEQKTKQEKLRQQEK